MEDEDQGGDDSEIRFVSFDWRNLDSAPRLSHAVRNGNLDAVKKMIHDGAEVNAADNRGWTPLHEGVADDRNYDIVEELIKSGSYIEHQTVEEETPLFLAAKNGSIRILELLIREGGVVNCPNLQRHTPLHVAACLHSSCEPVLTTLIAAGADLGALDIENRTALHSAVEENNLIATRILLDAGIDPKIFDFFGRNAAISACMIGSVEILELVLGKLGNRFEAVNYRSKDGWTLLMEAIQFKHLEVVKHLISCGADPCSREGRGLLALHLAAHSGRADIFKLVLDHTPTEAIEATSVPSSHGIALHTRSLLGLAIDKNSYESVEILLSRKDLSDSVLTCPIIMGHSNVSPVSYLLKHANSVPHGEDKLKMLKLLLTKHQLVDYKYHKKLNVINATEAAVSIHERNHSQHNCVCSEYLRLILEKGGDADSPHIFNKALEYGFTSGISLLLSYSNTQEPEQLLKSMWTDLHKTNHSWSGTEADTFTYLMELSTNQQVSFERILQTPINPSLLSVRRLVVTKRRPASLKRLARYSFRKYLHKETSSKPSSFLATVKLLNAPKSIVSFLMYSDII